MDRIHTPRELELEAELAQLREAHRALQALRRPVRLPGKPWRGTVIFLLGLPLVALEFLGAVWLDRVPRFEGRHVYEFGLGLACVTLVTFLFSAGTRGEKYDALVTEWKQLCLELAQTPTT